MVIMAIRRSTHVILPALGLKKSQRKMFVIKYHKVSKLVTDIQFFCITDIIEKKRAHNL